MDRVVQSELDLVGNIYDAVLEPDRWSDTIDRIRRYVGLHLGAIGISYLPSGVSIQATTNISPEFVQELAATADTIPELWGGPHALARLPVYQPFRMLEYSSPECWPGNPFYERFCRPQRLVDQLCLLLETSSTMYASFSLGVQDTMPPIDEDQVEVFRVLVPHFRRAVLTTNLLEARSLATASFEAVLNALGSAVMLVDADLRISYANEMAEQMLRSRDPVAVLGGRLHAPNELVPGNLARSVAAAAGNELSLNQGGGIAVRKSDGTGMTIHVLPLTRRAIRPRIQAVAAVFVAQPNSELKLPMEAIRLLYELSPSELRVLELIVAGRSGKGVASALGVSENTAKTHTMRLFDKVGVHSRTELLRVVREASSDNVLLSS